MTPQQFQKSTHREKLETFIKSPEGQAALNALSTFNPPFSTNENPHLFAKAVGQREGFELCMRAFILLSTIPKIHSEVEANYQVEDKK